MRPRPLLANLAISLCLAAVTAATPSLAAPPAPKVVPHVAAPSSAPAPAKPAAKAPSVAIPIANARDWAKAPAIVEHAAAGEILAVSDLHGHYEHAFKLFTGNGVVRGRIDDPSHVEWTGGNATLVVVGDSINKGPGSVKIIDMLRRLQQEAPKVGGKVIVTLGNHEAEFLHDPLSERSLRDGSKDAGGRTGLGHELRLHRQDPEAVAAGKDAAGRGEWLRTLPFAAKVNDYFFVHSGSTGGQTQDELARSIQRAMAKGGFGHEHLIGMKGETPLGSDDWKATADDAAHNAEKLGVKHIVMGHIPDALNGRGEIAKNHDGTLIKIDTGLGNGDGDARMLRIGLKGGIKQLDADGERAKLHKHDGH